MHEHVNATNTAVNTICPHCGYCPHCGRLNTPFYPYTYPTYPTYPSPIWTSPYTVTC